MAKKISELPAASQANDADQLEANQGGTSRRVTRAQVVAGLASTTHTHVLASITDAGALAARNSVDATVIDADAVTMAKIANGAVTPAKLDRGYAEAGHTHAEATTGAAGFMSATDKAKLDGVAAGAQVNAAIATQAEAQAGSDNTKAMTPLRTAQAIGQQAAPVAHTHTVAAITDAGALAARNSVDATVIDADAVTTAKIADGAVAPAKLDRGYAESGHTHAEATTGAAGFMSAADKAKLNGVEAGAQVNRAVATQAEAQTGTDNAKAMTPLRTAQAIGQQAAPVAHTHTLAAITDAGALAARNSVDATVIDADAVTTAKIADGAVTPAKLDRGYAEAGHSHAEATTGAAGFISATDKAKLDGVEAGAQVNRAVATQAEAQAGSDNTKAMTPLRTAQAIGQQAAPVAHTHTLAAITGAGALAGKNTVAAADIDTGAVTEAKIGAGQVTADKLYAASAAVPAPVAGVSTISSYAGGVNFYSATDNTTTTIRLAEPPARRKIFILNATGNSINILKDADGSTIRAGLPNRYLIELSNNGAGVWAFFAEYAVRLHQHPSSDITGTFGTTSIANGAVTPAKLDRSYAEVGHTHAEATASVAGFMSAADKAKLNGVEAGAQVNRALATQAEAQAGTDNAKAMTPLRTAQAIAQQAAPAGHTHTLASITDAGALAALDVAATDDIADAAVTPAKLAHVEDAVAGAYTFAAADRGKVKVYTGSGATWTVPNLGTGRVDVVNDGTGPITLAASGVTLRGATSIAAGQAASLFCYSGGAKVHASILEGWLG